MANKGQINAEELKIQGLLDRYLQFRNKNLTTRSSENHIDEDSLTAFVEGKLSDSEMPFILKHLVNCSFCLHVTGELIKLDAVFAEEETVAATPPTAPAKVSDVLSGLLSRIFGSNDGTVFAHQEKDEEEKEDEKKDS